LTRWTARRRQALPHPEAPGPAREGSPQRVQPLGLPVAKIPICHSSVRLCERAIVRTSARTGNLAKLRWFPHAHSPQSHSGPGTGPASAGQHDDWHGERLEVTGGAQGSRQDPGASGDEQRGHVHRRDGARRSDRDDRLQLVRPAPLRSSLPVQLPTTVSPPSRPRPWHSRAGDLGAVPIPGCPNSQTAAGNRLWSSPRHHAHVNGLLTCAS